MECADEPCDAYEVEQTPQGFRSTHFEPLHFNLITGQHRNGVISARTRIDVLLDTFRRKQPFTHFLSFFLNEVEVQEGFLRFQEEVLAKCSMYKIQVLSVFLASKLKLTGVLGSQRRIKLNYYYLFLTKRNMFARL
ncbi:hypothetical protein P7K49_023932, partial [Saguinus oedipus]